MFYAHTSPSGRRYIGQTARGMCARWRRHIREARAGSTSAFHRAIRKYGPAAFSHELLERMSTLAGAHRAEQIWIARLETFGPRGYNETAGGEGTLGRPGPLRGRKHKLETRAKIGLAQLGRPATAGMLGRTHTAETLEKMRAACARRAPVSHETRRKMSEAAKQRTAKKGKVHGHQ